MQVVKEGETCWRHEQDSCGDDNNLEAIWANKEFGCSVICCWIFPSQLSIEELKEHEESKLELKLRIPCDVKNEGEEEEEEEEEGFRQVIISLSEEIDEDEVISQQKKQFKEQIKTHTFFIFYNNLKVLFQTHQKKN